MWCAQAGISATTRADHAAYLAQWLRVLRADARALVTVAARAQAAVDHLTTLAGHPTEANADEEASEAA
jgi:antirestriction protein ArdC